MNDANWIILDELDWIIQSMNDPVTNLTKSLTEFDWIMHHYSVHDKVWEFFALLLLFLYYSKNYTKLLLH